MADVRREPKCAWVTLVLVNENELYATGAAVLAASLKSVNTKYPLVLMYNGLSDATIEWLRGFYDELIEVPLIEAKSAKLHSAKQQGVYGSWIDRSYTKWNCTNPEIIHYDKIMLLDADCMFVKNCDELFELHAPAGVLSNPWAYPFAKRHGMYNPYMKRDGNHNVPPRHGDAISVEELSVGLRCSFVAPACNVLIEPSKVLYEQICQLLRDNVPYGNTRCISGMDEQVLAEATIKLNLQWTMIHQCYGWIVGKTDWCKEEDAKLWQWYSSKPWTSKRGEWSDLNRWYAHWDQIYRDTDVPVALRVATLRSAARG